MIRFELDDILLKHMLLSTEEYNFLINKGVSCINGFLARKNVPCHISNDDKISIVHDALIRFEEFYDNNKEAKPSTFFYYVLKNCLINSNTKAQKLYNNEALTGDDVLFAELEGGFNDVK